MKLLEGNHTTIGLIDKHYEDQQDPNRYHLGCSTLGHKCERWLWLSFRWAVTEKFPGRMLRLFERGQLEEDRLVKMLRAIGCNVLAFDHEGKQFRVDFGSHVSGSTDGVIESGLPESPDKVHVVEFKTHSLKSFNDLVKNGVEKSKPMHYAQMQVYMEGMGYDRAFYIAVCKNDDQLYTERVKLDRDHALRLIEKGKRIALSDRMPPPLAGASPSWFECKFCPAYDNCHQDQPIEAKNCRTCVHSVPTEDSKWQCSKWNSEIPKDVQPKGCDEYEIHPDMVNLNA